MRYTTQVGDDGFDAITLSLNFRLESLHLVAVKGIGDILRTMSVYMPWNHTTMEDAPDEY